MSNRVKQASSAAASKRAEHSIAVGDRDSLLALGAELFQLTFDFLGELGVTREEREAMLAGVGKSRKRVQLSNKMTASSADVGRMLTEWRRDKKYTTVEGEPKVIPVHGKGATFESLVQKYAPLTSVAEALKIACDKGEVQRVKKEMVAMVGSHIILQNESTEECLAAFITRVRALSANCLYNLDHPGKGGDGYLERRVSVALSSEKFRQLAQEIRPELCNWTEDIDMKFQQSAGDKPGKDAVRSGIILFLFREDGPLY
jgi:hypothetical protein